MKKLIETIVSEVMNLLGQRGSNLNNADTSSLVRQFQGLGGGDGQGKGRGQGGGQGGGQGQGGGRGKGMGGGGGRGGCR